MDLSSYKLNDNIFANDNQLGCFHEGRDIGFIYYINTVDSHVDSTNI